VVAPLIRQTLPEFGRIAPQLPEMAIALVLCAVPLSTRFIIMAELAHYDILILGKTLEVKSQNGELRALAGERVVIDVGTRTAIRDVPWFAECKSLTHVESPGTRSCSRSSAYTRLWLRAPRAACRLLPCAAQLSRLRRSDTKGQGTPGLITKRWALVLNRKEKHP
jgi:hypothetical protein